jgi:hypothetical protein
MLINNSTTLMAPKPPQAMSILDTPSLARRALLARKATRALLAGTAPLDAMRASLQLGDALDRLAFLLSDDEPLSTERVWRVGQPPILVGELFEAAHLEFAAAVSALTEHADVMSALGSTLVTELRSLLTDVARYSARVNNTSRGGSLLGAPSSGGAPGRVLTKGAHFQADTQLPSAPQPQAPSPTNDAPAAEAPTPEIVGFVASAPAKTHAGDEFVARFAACLPQDEANVRAALTEAAPDAKLSPMPKSGGLLRNTAVEIVLECKGLQIDGANDRAARQFLWDGKPQFVEFDVAVPPNELPRKAVLKFYIRIVGIVLERILLELEINTQSTGADSPAPVVAAKRLPSSAFASYSSIDRPRVIDRVAAIRIAAGIDVFLDCMDLNPSEKWEPRLYHEIEARELFILFWSQSAKQSRWVTLEYEHAHRVKGLDAMQIQPLENGVSPPKELKSIHVADPYADLAFAARSRQPTD